MAGNSKKSYVVVAPLVITKKEDGQDLYLYEGAVLPDFVKDDEAKRLLDEKYVLEASEAAAAASVPTAESN